MDDVLVASAEGAIQGTNDSGNTGALIVEFFPFRKPRFSALAPFVLPWRLNTLTAL